VILAGTVPPTGALPQQADAALTGVLVFAAAVWVGGLVAIFVVARVARRTLRPAERVAFFRCLGRAYGPVGGLALALALVSGAVLLSGHPWDGQVTAATAAAAAGCLVAVTVAGVMRARRMTRLRHRALGNPGDPGLARQVWREAITAAILRALIAALSLALLALGVLLAG
jgi:uncharacterized membrane protein